MLFFRITGVICAGVLALGGLGSTNVSAQDWSGFYVGGQIGYQGTNADFEDPAFIPSLSGSYSPDGFVGGGHVGYNLQTGNVVFGVEADIEVAGGSDSGPGFIGGVGAPFVTGSGELNWQGSVRARLGLAVNQTLVYATAGVVFGDFDFGYTFPVVGGVTDTFSDTLTGWTAGVGAQQAVSNNLSVRVEYRYTDYGDASGSIINCCAPPPFAQRHDLDAHAVRIGVSYRLWP